MIVKACSAGRPAALAVTLALVLLALTNTPALAGESGAQWTVTSVSRPTNFAPFAAGDEAGEDAYEVTVTNTGGSPTNGEPVVISDELPNGLSSAGEPAGEGTLAIADKSPDPEAHFSCVFRECTYSAAVGVGDTLIVKFPVAVLESAPTSCAVPGETVSCVDNVVRVAGGGAPDASIGTPTTISKKAAGFGLSPGGSTTAFSTDQAGAHPDFTTSLAFNTVDAKGALAGEPRQVTDVLPPGFAGDLVDTPACPASVFTLRECAIDTQVGITTLTYDLFGDTYTETLPVYNLAPNAGELAKIGFALGAGGEGDVGIQGNVTLDSDYGLETSFYNIDQNALEIDNDSLTIWGVPASPIHDAWRFSHGQHTTAGFFGVASEVAPVPFFTSPTACGSEPAEARLTVVSWEQQRVEEGMPFGPLVGCDRVTMEPSLTVETTTSSASAPTGLDLDMQIPQTYENPEGVATSTLQRAVVTLPEGMTVNPSAGAGLGACTPAQYAEEERQAIAGRGCPNESKLGTVRIVTPSLKEEVTGSVFLAQPFDNPFGSAEHPGGSLLALYIVARASDRGVLIKVAGEVQANPLTGQLVTTFDDLPPLPFSTFLFSFRQGATSPLVMPPTCASYTVQAQLTPLSDVEGAPLTPAIPPFTVNSGVDGEACPSGVPPFAPGVAAGTLNNSAGAYSPLEIRITRGDGEQEITGFSTQLPPGLTANLSDLPFCSEAAIAHARERTGAQEEAEPSCPSASQIGRTLVGAGVGSVLAQAPGKIYMGGPYQGDPFSIVAITSARVGPFDLGTVVVHLPLSINPLTAAVSVAAGGTDQIPHIIKGIVVHVRDIRVYVERPGAGFTINPTNCARLALAATVIGSGASFTDPADADAVTVTDPFQAADCASLKFEPKFSVSTSGRTSRVNGASLSVKLTYPAAPQGTQSNIAKVKVDLPKRLPSRLTTLQKACTEQTFDANPASCPAASVIGHASAVTPILPVPLAGPAYFVSHGGAKFPELVAVLQGYGVTIDLHGETFISNIGVTSSTFAAVPDQPVTSFELTLPEGPYSALAANGDLCTSKLVMPTAFFAQNGMEIHRSTPIGVTGCARSKALTRSQQLGHALKLCKKDRNRQRRRGCERRARKRYGPASRKRRGKK
ncbi:MAG TPA: hypothetical protein VK756_06425 [Solirubrobacteraceae bacterium]|jgi:uncharacterized repeat protein (TIGR01451 family)|nr:hypothetical protein [Solirubrobacteraceae bacterium]